ncbi:MAG: hypothetical protein ACRD4C_08965 [Candidatus Acidiferrales bacterium]
MRMMFQKVAAIMWQKIRILQGNNQEVRSRLFDSGFNFFIILNLPYDLDIGLIGDGREHQLSH